jgi:hypothetical protein
MNYQDAGYDEFLTIVDRDQQDSGISSSGMDPQAFDNFTDQISGSKIQGGLILSPDGRMRIDLDQGFLRVSDGVQDLVQLGVLEDGKIGMLIKASDGTVLMKVTSDEQFLQSIAKTMRMDFVTEQLTIRDIAQRLRVLLGKDLGGF